MKNTVKKSVRFFALYEVSSYIEDRLKDTLDSVISFEKSLEEYKAENPDSYADSYDYTWRVDELVKRKEIASILEQILSDIS